MSGKSQCAVWLVFWWMNFESTWKLRWKTMQSEFKCLPKPIVYHDTEMPYQNARMKVHYCRIMYILASLQLSIQLLEGSQTFTDLFMDNFRTQANMLSNRCINRFLWFFRHHDTWIPAVSSIIPGALLPLSTYQSIWYACWMNGNNGWTCRTAPRKISIGSGNTWLLISKW